jgi:hypothetical protein
MVTRLITYEVPTLFEMYPAPPPDVGAFHATDPVMLLMCQPGATDGGGNRPWSMATLLQVKPLEE